MIMTRKLPRSEFPGPMTRNAWAVISLLALFFPLLNTHPANSEQAIEAKAYVRAAQRTTVRKKYFGFGAVRTYMIAGLHAFTRK
jgi:hypothetical protein